MADAAKFELRDPCGGGGRIAVEVVANRGGQLEIRVAGLGDKCSENGQGTPILLEAYEGSIVLHVWADINREDPTHRIDLGGAREALRRDGA